MPDSLTDWRRPCRVPSLGLTLDVSRMMCGEGDLARRAPAMERAFRAMAELEKGAVANPDEKRRVGHYWLRAPRLAPEPALAREIEAGLAQVKSFAADVHAGRIAGPVGPFRQLLLVGIGGSALGPMFVADALGQPGRDRMAFHVIDNTDPDGVARTLAPLKGLLDRTLVVVTSKSGGTPETRNGMLLVQKAFRDARLDFGRQAVAVTMPGSKLDDQAKAEKWLGRFPMFDWVGGRTSEMSAVGLLPAALQGLDVDGLLAGAAACDEATRVADIRANPAALMALMWHHATDG